jgi:3-phosphoshikimate 1-carboxyvinyltransferase
VTCRGLDLTDVQGDKAVVAYLRQMGADIHATADAIRVRPPAAGLHGVELDLDATPDALPAMAVTACFAHGTTRLHNVAHARIKETDRIAVMARELRKLGADLTERPDGLEIRGGQPLHGGVTVEGHHDHRVVMALALAGLCLPEGLAVTTAEAAGVTFPEFADLLRALGGNLATA